MNCPHCDSDSYITHTDITTATRTRCCLECKREFDTIEILANEHPGHIFRMHKREILSRANRGKT